MGNEIRIINQLKEPALLGDAIEYQEGAIVSKILWKDPGGNLTLFAFDADQALSEHTAPFDAMVLVIEGRGEITIDGEIKHMQTGEIILMPAGHPHAVRALEPFKMLLIMIKSQAREDQLVR